MALVAAGLVNLALVFGMVGVHNGYTTDEVDYLAKVNPAAPHLYWSAVRAWGTPLLAAPVALLNPGVGLVRVYFALLLGVGLVLAYLPWRRVLHPAAAPLAAFLFATTWFTTFYGNHVMPNLPIAFGCIAAAGLWAGLPQSSRPRRSLLWLTLVVGGVAVVRPTDGLLLAVPLAALTVLDRRRDRRLGVVALVVGEAIGWIPWIVEAYLSFGGPLARWHQANSAVQGLHPSFALVSVYPRLFDGAPGYCCHGGPPDMAGPASGPAIAWFIGILVLSAAGLVAARGHDQRFAVGACLGIAGAFILMYVGLLDYGAMRFLLPIVGVLAVPVSAAMVSAVTTSPRRISALAMLGCLGLIGAHLWLQIGEGTSVRSRGLVIRNVDSDFAAQIRRFVRHRPCLVVAPEAQVLGYYLRCHIVEPDPTIPLPSAARAVSAGWSVVAIDGPRPHGAYAFIRQEAWERHRLHANGALSRLYLYVAPGTVSTKASAATGATTGG